MKTHRSSLIALLSSLLALCLVGCISEPPPPPPPAPDPPPVVVDCIQASYIITEYSEAGTVERTWHVTSYAESEFPRQLTFQYDGRTITLSGSYQIDQITP